MLSSKFSFEFIAHGITSHRISILDDIRLIMLTLLLHRRPIAHSGSGSNRSSSGSSSWWDDIDEAENFQGSNQARVAVLFLTSQPSDEKFYSRSPAELGAKAINRRRNSGIIRRFTLSLCQRAAAAMPRKCTSCVPQIDTVSARRAASHRFVSSMTMIYA